MTLKPGIFVHKDGTTSTTPEQARLALAGLIASEGGLAVRWGVFWAPDLATALVAGTAGWAYSVGKASFATSREEADGVRLFVNDGAVSVATTAAPGSDSRYDLIYVYAPSKGENSDTDSQPVFGVVQGTPSATPERPTGSVPAGAHVVAEALVSSGDADTSEATITQLWPYTTVRGVPLPVRNATERDAAATDMATSGFPFEVVQLDATAGERWKVTEDGGTTWSNVLQASGTAPDVQVFTADGTWNKPANAVAVRCRLVGAGGAAGGVEATGSGEVAAGAGGGGGAYAEHVFEASTLGSSESVTVGAGGVAVSGSDGGDGTASTFAGITSGGGKGGSVGLDSTAPYPLSGAPGDGGSVSGGIADIEVSGGPGGYGFPNTAANPRGGYGGAGAVLGASTPSAGANNQDGQSGSGYGNGGSGAHVGASQSARPGGDGAAGVVIVETFF